MRRILRIDAVRDATGLGRSTIYRMVANSEFPAPVKMTNKASGWIEDEVAEWINGRTAKRDAERRGRR